MPTKRTAGRFAAVAAGIIAVVGGRGPLGYRAARGNGESRAAAPPGTHHARRARALRLWLAGTDTGAGSTASLRPSSSPTTLGGRVLAAGLPGAAAGPARRIGGPRPGIGPGRGALFAGMSPAQMRLRPGGQASFFLVYRDFNPRTGRPGAPVGALRVGLSGVPGQFTVRARFAPFGPLSVSPVRADGGQG